MINPKILQNIIKPDKVFLNTISKNKFIITKLDEDKVYCRAFTKLKRGAAVTQVNYDIKYEIFVLYLENQTFKVLE